MTTSDADVRAAVHRFCSARGIPTDKDVVAITIQENRGARFGAIIFDLEAGRQLSNYPRANDLVNGRVEFRAPSSRGADYLVCYRAGLPTVSDKDVAAVQLAAAGEAAGERFPCCASMQEYRPRYLDREDAFTRFKNSSGTVDSIVFELKTQVDNGPLLSTEYYALANGVRQKVTGSFPNKLHAYKNYKCTVHNRFFAVDLRSTSGVGAYVYNDHHMRVNPFSQNVDTFVAMVAEMY